MFTHAVLGLGVALCTLSLAAAVGAAVSQSSVFTFGNPTGQSETLVAGGQVDLNNPFFQDLGTNGRRCVTCHMPDQGWSVSAESVQQRFALTAGHDAIFRTNDGSNCTTSDVSTVTARRLAYSLLLERGLFRVGLNVPANAEFFIESVDDPYNCDTPTTPLLSASVYRRPLPSANLRFNSAVMWDARISKVPATLEEDLARQANAATRGHAAAQMDLTDAERQAIVKFEMSLFTAQSRDMAAGDLDGKGAEGGAMPLSKQPFVSGINDPAGASFNPKAFTIFNAWASDRHSSGGSSTAKARLAIARGQDIFNSKSITLRGVPGTCTSCHNTPNAGSRSTKLLINIGTSDASHRAGLPLYTLRNVATGAAMETTDPGLAMNTGKWADIGKFKIPVLRGLTSRAPYFHNGSAATLDEVVEFYNQHFAIGLTAGEKADLATFLRSL
jgi:cytochrome c peroxidase